MENAAAEKKRLTIEKRQARLKKIVLENLREIPTIITACAKSGISHATYYRWLAEDSIFRSEAEKARCQGNDLMRERARANIFRKVLEGDLSASKYLLDRDFNRLKGRPIPENEFKEGEEITLHLDL